jgi:transposase-like protein
VIGLDVGEAETEAFWREFLRSLRASGLTGVRLCVSDCHEGLRAAVGPAADDRGGDPLDLPGDLGRGGEVVERLEPVARRSRGCCSRQSPTCSPSYAFPKEHWSKLRSTAPLERVNREIGRRTDVVGILPNDAALIRLAGSLLVEQNDEWLVSRRYSAGCTYSAHVLQQRFEAVRVPDE